MFFFQILSYSCWLCFSRRMSLWLQCFRSPFELSVGLPTLGYPHQIISAKEGRGSSWLIEKAILDSKSRNIQTFPSVLFSVWGSSTFFLLGREGAIGEGLCLRGSETGDLSVSFVFSQH